jgi:hypothetical protein
MEEMQLFHNFFPVVIKQPVLWGKDKNINKAVNYKALVYSQTSIKTIFYTGFSIAYSFYVAAGVEYIC